VYVAKPPKRLVSRRRSDSSTPYARPSLRSLKSGMPSPSIVPTASVMSAKAL
jgi:hypothetical protein